MTEGRSRGIIVLSAYRNGSNPPGEVSIPDIIHIEDTINEFCYKDERFMGLLHGIKSYPLGPNQ